MDGIGYINKWLGTSPFLLDDLGSSSRFRGSAHLSHLRTQKTLEQLGAAASLCWKVGWHLLLRAGAVGQVGILWVYLVGLAVGWFFVG